MAEVKVEDATQDGADPLAPSPEEQKAESFKPKFELGLKIVDLNNVPLICGTSYVKWHLPSSSSAEHRGQTRKALIREHKAIYGYNKVLPVRLTVDRSQMLQECEVQFEVLQEYSEGGKGGRVSLGIVKINLAEYVDDGNRPGISKSDLDPDGGEDGGGVMRRYLMQESKINSTLKIGIKMHQLEGDSNFIAPPLKSAMVFGGIAGVMSSEVGDGVNDTSSGSIPSVTKRTREAAELQDMYRHTLAASWLCRSDELPPDKLIEDLFAGGDGGSMKPPPPIFRSSASHNASSQPSSPRPDEENTNPATTPTNSSIESANASESDSRRTIRTRFLTPETARRGQDSTSPASTPKPDSRDPGTWSPSHNRAGLGSTSSPHLSTRSGSGARDTVDQQQQQQQMEQSKETWKKGSRKTREISEFQVREDLRSWEIETR